MITTVKKSEIKANSGQNKRNIAERNQIEIRSQRAGRVRLDRPIYLPKLATGDAKQHDSGDDDDDYADDDNDAVGDEKYHVFQSTTLFYVLLIK